ncbi:TonB family protein [Palleniella muris]|uniref:TonB family protein n=1 Tax=Palleniella muris TaxID=3038145 RepID=A0AC61QQX6_9BACT|nr:M56 family metallopeptidase [Palleniella muris]TGX82380.1 TonB family protein [Palleniella muris]
MGEFLVYSVKVSLCLVMFYIFYRLLLSRTTLHTFNRFVLLSLVALSLVLPFVHVTVGREAQPMAVGTIAIDSLMLTIMEQQEEQEFRLNATHFALMAYVIGVIIFTARMIVSYIGIYRMMRKAEETITTADGIRIHILRDDTPPFSWFGNIIIGRSDYESNSHAIITHETAHIRRLHSADILLCNVLAAVQWFNPAAWLLKSELQDIHEYEADEAVLDSGVNATAYQMLLVRKAVGDQLFAIANNLNKYSLKKRITMMKTEKTNRWECVKALVALPLAAVAVVAFANPEMEKMEESIVENSETLVRAADKHVFSQPAETEKPTVAAKEETPAVKDVQPKDDDKAYDVVEEMPQFPGGPAALMKFLGENIKYPKEAGTICVAGRVIVSFIVDTDGSITDVALMKSLSPEFNNEAVRVVKAMPKWIPGKQKGKPVRVKYFIPVVFRNDTATKSGSASQAVSVGTNDTKAPLIIVNGKPISETEYKSIKDIKPDNIEKVDILKNEESTKQYGEKGKNGVILITLKR